VSLLDDIAWRAVLGWLERYCRKNTSIRHCFIRHSTAWSAQKVWVSDYDLAFFVEAESFSQVDVLASKIRRDLKRGLILDAIVLPASPNAYHLCASHYVHRSLYPMKRWRCVHGPPIKIPDTASYPLPLDHSPEGFLYGYVTPILQKQRQPRLAHKTLMKRKLARESLQIRGTSLRCEFPSELYEVVAEDIRLWDEFYEKLSFQSNNEIVEVRFVTRRSCALFADRWATADVSPSKLRGVESVWVYPGFRDDTKPYVVLNFGRSVSRDDCKSAIDGLLKTFRGLAFDLLLGTQRSMIGRLNGLSRATLLEPWLCKASGQCLYGDESVIEKILEPSVEQLKEKLREYFLYLAYRVFPSGPWLHSLYRLCFTMDYLFRHHELVLGSQDLADIYGQEILQNAGLLGTQRRDLILDAFKTLHGLDLFQTARLL
jgi:hypothetical protein